MSESAFRYLINELQAEFEASTLPDAKDEWGAEEDASRFVEDQVDDFRYRLEQALQRSISDHTFPGGECQECEGTGECPCCDKGDCVSVVLRGVEFVHPDACGICTDGKCDECEGTGDCQECKGTGVVQE